MVGMKKIEKFGKVFINHGFDHLQEVEKYTELKTAIFSNLDMRWYDLCGDVHKQAQNYKDKRISIGLTVENMNRFGRTEKFEGKFCLPVKFGEISSPTWDYVEVVGRVEWNLAKKFQLIFEGSENEDEDDDDDLSDNDWERKSSKMFSQAQGSWAFLAPKRKLLLESDFLGHFSFLSIFDDLLDTMTDGNNCKSKGSAGFKNMEYLQFVKYFSQTVDIFHGKNPTPSVLTGTTMDIKDISSILRIENIGLSQMLQFHRIFNGLINVAAVIKEEALRFAGADDTAAEPVLNCIVEFFHAEALSSSREWNQKDHSVNREAQANLGNVTCGVVTALEAIALQTGEFATDGAQNEVYILHVVEEWPLVDALTKVVNDANQSLRKMEEYEKLLLKLFHDDQQLLEYTQIMKDIVCGTFQWIHISNRYHSNLKFDCYID